MIPPGEGGRRARAAQLLSGVALTLLTFLVLLGTGVLPGLTGTPAAQAVEGPPPTPVPPKGSPSPFLQRLDDNEGPATKAPKLRARSAMLADLDTGQPLYALRPTLRRPIASLTKVMTGLLTIEKTDPDEEVQVSAEAAPPAHLIGISALGLKAGETLSVKQLMYALLLQSANDAAVALAEHISGSSSAFEHLMNHRADELGMHDTRFASPNGLDDDGYSTAADLAVLTQAAMAEPEFARIVRTKEHTIPPAEHGQPPRKVQNRNVLLWLYPGATGAKTGFTTKAGYCVIGTATRGGRSLVAVVLGDRGEAFSDAARLLTYGFKGFSEERVLDEGEELGTRAVNGVPTELVAGADLDLLVPKKGGAPQIHIIVDPQATSAEPGHEVGQASAVLGRTVLGSVPAVVSSSVTASPPAAPAPSGSDTRVSRLVQHALALVGAAALAVVEDHLLLS